MELFHQRGDVTDYIEHDELTNKTIIKTVQDVEGYLNQNQVERNASSTNWRGDLHKVASIPVVLIERWNQEFKCNVLEPKNRHLLMLKINDRDFLKLRTKLGRV